MSKKQIATLGLVMLSLVVLMSQSSNAQGWLKKATGGKVETPKVIRSIAPNGISIKPKQDSGSSLSVIVHYITSSGRVMYGSNTGNVRDVGQAKMVYSSSGTAYWVSNGAENSPLRAGSKYDRKKSTLMEVDANSGIVYRVSYVNGNRTTERVAMTRLTVQYNNQGRPYYAYNGQVYWATNQPWRTTTQPQNSQFQQQNTVGNQSSQQLSPGAQLAIGILQALQQAQQNQRRP